MIIFTANINAYDNIPDHYYDGDVKYVMFYDKPIEQKGPWEFIELDCKYDDPILNAYHTRCMSHLFFDEPHVWIDGCYTMTEQFVKNSREFLEKNEITQMMHPGRRTVLGELLKTYRLGFVPEERLYRWCEKVAASGFKSDYFSHTINCCIWRNNTQRVKEWNENYWGYHFVDGEFCHHIGQITAGIAEYLVFGENRIARVPVQVDLSHSTREKKYNDSYKIFPNNYVEEFKERVARILDLNVDKEPPCKYEDQITDQLIVYTCITNSYDEFPEDSYYEEDVRYVCFHDGTIDTSIGPWEYVQLDLDIEDPRDFAYYVKAHPHEFFPKDSHTVWIDACFKLTKQFVDNSMKSFPFSVLRHGGRFTYIDEVLEGYTCAFFTESSIINLSKDLALKNYNFKEYSSPQCTILWRKLTDDVIKFNKTWYEWGNRGYNRDNIPFDAAIQFTGITPKFYDKRDSSGIEFGYFNKVGRRGLHPQHGDKKQYLRKDDFLHTLHPITGLHPKLYAKYTNHEFYMRVFGII